MGWIVIGDHGNSHAYNFVYTVPTVYRLGPQSATYPLRRTVQFAVHLGHLKNPETKLELASREF